MNAPIATETPRPGSLQRMVRRRVELAKARLNERWLEECDRALDTAGVPKWVCLHGESVPSNTVPSRLRWYLARRKDVKPAERDGLDREMELAMQDAREFMVRVEPPNAQAQRTGTL
jgi:hypothetical protein